MLSYNVFRYRCYYYCNRILTLHKMLFFRIPLKYCLISGSPCIIHSCNFDFILSSHNSIFIPFFVGSFFSSDTLLYSRFVLTLCLFSPQLSVIIRFCHILLGWTRALVAAIKPTDGFEEIQFARVSRFVLFVLARFYRLVFFDNGVTVVIALAATSQKNIWINRAKMNAKKVHTHQTQKCV